MIRPFLFQIHWFLGITAGLVLAVMGITGATLSFEDEIMASISPGIVTLTAPAPAIPLLPDALIAKAESQRPGHHVTALMLSTLPTHSAQVAFDPASPGRGRGELSYINPYNGSLLGSAHGQAFFATVRRVHRFLALPGDGNGPGRVITGASAIALIYFALSGMYLRWPRQALYWRAWLVLDLRRTGRNLYRTLHAVIGGWMFAFYLLSALTGMWWSYGWYRQGVTYALTGKLPPAHTETGAPKGDQASTPSLNVAWSAFQHATTDRFEEIFVIMPLGHDSFHFRARLLGARHDRMEDEITVTGDGHVLTIDRYANRPVGRVLTSGMLILHQGSFFGLPGRIILTLTSLSMPLFAVTGFLLYVSRRQRKRELKRLLPLPALEETPSSPALLIVYASQTGRAQHLARRSARAFENAGQPTRVLSLAALTTDELVTTTRALFVVSTYGDGEPPDEARVFARRSMSKPLELNTLKYGLLALGDREYADFCAFGRRLDHWLRAQGALSLFERVDVDGDDEDARQRWMCSLAQLGADRTAMDLHSAPYVPWQLGERRVLNTGSPGAPVVHLTLVPTNTADWHHPSWQPGDLAEIMPRQPQPRVEAWLKAQHSTFELSHTALAERLATAELAGEPQQLTSLDALKPLRPREYSITSMAASGRLELLVRQSTREDGQPGVASDWLCREAPLTGEIVLRIRPNPGFRPPTWSQPLILIGNGTGLAGLLAHLRHRHAKGLGQNWLLYGERSRLHDRPHRDELDGYLAQGLLTRMDLIFSREPDGGYVQELIDRHGEILKQWVAQGAAILVCGSLAGMAPAVDLKLRAWLGDDVIENMVSIGRYRRDVY